MLFYTYKQFYFKQFSLLGAMAIKGYVTFPKALLGPHVGLLSVIYRSLVGGVLPLYRDAVGIFYSPSWLGLLGGRLTPLQPIGLRKVRYTCIITLNMPTSSLCKALPIGRVFSFEDWTVIYRLYEVDSFNINKMLIASNKENYQLKLYSYDEQMCITSSAFFNAVIPKKNSH